ncbi:MAG: alpha/beta hydrolase [Actinomycetota bacterium]|nr:alpha/beta hydrolase [Actinomycetota bacterium]
MSRSPALGATHEVDTAMGRIRYRDTGGAGEPIVFVHGLFVNGDLWRKAVPLLEARHRCIAPDWPLGSHELGMDPGADLSLPGLAALVDAFLAALDLESVTLVGNDTGGAITQLVLLNHPERVARAVITPCDAFDNFPPKVLLHLKWLGRFRAMTWTMGQALRLRLVQRLPLAFGWATIRPIDREAADSYGAPTRTSAAVRRDFAAAARAIDKRHTQEAAAQLDRVRVPVLVAWSRHDRLFPMAHGRRLAELIPGASFTVVEDSGAFVPEDQPALLANAITDFVTERQTAAN